MFQFSLGGYFRFFSRKSIGSNFRACLHAHKYSQNWTYLHTYILNGRHYFHVLLFSRVVIFAFFLGAKITTARKLMSLRYTNFGGDMNIFHRLDTFSVKNRVPKKRSAKRAKWSFFGQKSANFQNFSKSLRKLIKPIEIHIWSKNQLN